MLRFVAKMDTTRPIDVERRFIVSYFLSDDTILVFEPPQRNSGIIGGKFIERRRIKKPDDVNYYSAQVRIHAKFLTKDSNSLNIKYLTFFGVFFLHGTFPNFHGLSFQGLVYRQQCDVFQALVCTN